MVKTVMLLPCNNDSKFHPASSSWVTTSSITLSGEYWSELSAVATSLSLLSLKIQQISQVTIIYCFTFQLGCLYLRHQEISKWLHQNWCCHLQIIILWGKIYAVSKSDNSLVLATWPDPLGLLLVPNGGIRHNSSQPVWTVGGLVMTVLLLFKNMISYI